MKAKLYKGPKHGKTLEVKDDTHDLEFLAVPSLKDVLSDPPDMSISSVKLLYRRTNHTHPDGGTFFVFVPSGK